MAEQPAPLMLALFEPDIAQNAGAMLRTCACLGVEAAIIEPAGFPISDRNRISRRQALGRISAVAGAGAVAWVVPEIFIARPAAGTAR